MKLTRRRFVGSSAGVVVAAGLGAEAGTMLLDDATATPNFSPLALKGNSTWDALRADRVSDAMKAAAERAPRGRTTFWGLPFELGPIAVVRDRPHVEEAGVKAPWLVFLHLVDREPPQFNEHGFISATRGTDRLGEIAAEYVLEYADGTETRETVRRRHQIGPPAGENCLQAVPTVEPHSIRPEDRKGPPEFPWGISQTRVPMGEIWQSIGWLWAWENPQPDKTIRRIRIEPKHGPIVVAALTVGKASQLPLRWLPRQKAMLKLPAGERFDPALDAKGRLKQLRLDMGMVISTVPRKVYPNSTWATTPNNSLPEVREDEIHVEYTAHPDARFHLPGGATVAVRDLMDGKPSAPLSRVAPADRLVKLRVTEAGTNRPVPVKLHVHGESGEYLPPVDCHRIPNGQWFQDFAPEFQHQGRHYCVYIPGEATIRLPRGKVYIEVSKGFEVRPVRKVVEVGASTDAIEVTLERVLDWRARGWVTADTHVHFLSPATARLEGSAEGVNVVNLLSSQWGELMTNVGDFDGKTTYGSKEAGGDGEWLVRVGSENRQRVMGHISLLGYTGGLIAPMCTAGPYEAAVGDPLEYLLMEWAEECKSRGGLVVLPHFPNPRCENAADITSGVIDAVEMTSGGALYAGINPYMLSDWYRYLNCGYFVAAVGGTDKMSAGVPVGAIRTYARIPAGREFTYQSWMEAVRAGNTFASYGPLLEFAVDGKPPGSRITMKAGGGTVDVTWRVASVTVPMTKVDLIVNGEIRESRQVNVAADEGRWSVKIERSSWAALLVRGRHAGRPEIIAAHSSPIMLAVDRSEFSSAADAVTILEQIEGALAFLDTVGTRAEDAVYKRLRLKLTSAYRRLHDEMHRRGHFHDHLPLTHHTEGR